MNFSLHAAQCAFFDHTTSFLPDAHAPEGLLQEARATAARQFAVYQHAYGARLVDALRDDYPLVELALGVELFETSCHAYARAFPPSSNSLNFYGQHFASFLNTAVSSNAAVSRPAPFETMATPVSLGPELVWTFDLARVEWALIEAIHANASQVLTADAFGQFGPEEWSSLRLQTSETLHLLELDYDVPAYLAALETTDAVAPPEKRQSFLAICRRDNDLWRMPLPPWGFELLRQLASGVALDQALLNSCADATATEEQVFHSFARWLEAGVFRNVVPY